MNSISDQVKRGNGFSLVELLVVVAIITLLAGLLFPALNQVRAAREKSGCINNQRQIYLGIQAYTGEHDGFLPGPIYSACLTGFVKPDAYTKYRGNLAEYIFPYLGGIEPAQANFYARLAVFSCPGWARAVGSASQNLNNPKPKTCYLADTTYFGYPNFSSTLSSPHVLMTVSDPASTLILNDSDQKNYAYDTSLPATPIHNGKRNYLYFDGHIETK